MQYLIRGAHRNTGAAVERLFDAPDEAAARQLAVAADLMVETLTEIGARTTPGYAVRVLSASVEHGRDGVEAIRGGLEGLLNVMAAQGWEFVSVQTMPTVTLARQSRSGRIGGDDVPSNVALAVFRRGLLRPT